MAEIKADKIKIGDIFSDQFQFKIPTFQRPFVWKNDNFENLFEYIYSAFERKQEEYFLGSIIWQLQEKDGNFYYHIIDGQQRLVSLAILLAVIRDKTNDSDTKVSIQNSLFQREDKLKRKSSVPRIKMWEDLAFLEDYIYKEGYTEKFICDIEEGRMLYKDKEDPIYSFYEAIKIFREKYEEKFKDNESIVREFVSYLFNNVYVVYISTKSLPYAIQLFNVLNTQGLPLGTADILKAVNLAEIEENIRERFAKKWRDIERDIGRESLEKVIEFIRTLKLKTKAKASIYDEYEKLIFSKNLLKKGQEFIEYLEKISNIYKDYILEPEDLNIENKYKNLVKLMRDFIPFDDWIPPLIAFCEKFKDSGDRMSKTLPEFLYVLERKTIIEWVIGFTPTKRAESLNKIIKDIEQSESFIEAINKTKKVILNNEEVRKIFQEKINGKDFYNERFAKYLLLRIDLEKWDPENFKGYVGEITVEHILPQNPPENSEWINLFKEEEREEWTNKIGNLVLLGRKKNSRARNYDFKVKKNTYFFKEGATPFKITEEIKNFEEWNMENLKKRQENMVKELLKLYFER